MKKYHIRLSAVFFIAVLIIGSLSARASTTYSLSDFDLANTIPFDESEIYNAFSGIDEAVAMISESGDASYAELQTENSSILALIDNSTNAAFGEKEKFTFSPSLAYWTGCVFGSLGIVLVAIVNNGDDVALKKSIWGCVTSGCVSMGTGAVIYLIYFSFFFSYGYY